MKTQYYYIGQLARLCKDSVRNTSNPFPLKSIQQTVLNNPDECLKQCETFKNEILGDKLEIYEKIRQNYLHVSVDYPCDLYQISDEKKLRYFLGGYESMKPRNYFPRCFLTWLILASGTFVLIQILSDNYCKGLFNNALRSNMPNFAKGLLLVSLNPEKTVLDGDEKVKISDPSLLKKMLDLGFKPSPKQICDWYESPELLKIFLQNGGDINTPDSQGIPALYRVQTTKILDLILDEGKPDFKSRLEDGTNMAYHAQNVEILEWLADHGVDLTCESIYKENLFEYYLKKGNVSFMQFFANRKYDFNQEVGHKHCIFFLIDSKYDFNPELAEFMIQHGTQVNVLNWEHQTPIMLADTPEKFAFLIEHGADINVKDKQGNTLLHLADSPEKKKLLLEKGADFLAENRVGLTPLEYQLQGCVELQKEIATLEKSLSQSADEYDQQQLEDAKARLQEYVENINFYIEQGCDVSAVFKRLIARQTEFIPVFRASKLDLKALGY